MRTLFSDTHPKMEALQVRLWREASLTRKMQALAQLNASAKTLALAGLRSRFPQASEAELRYHLARVHTQTFTFENEISAKFASPEDTILSKLE
jgi:hypothetical protein